MALTPRCRGVSRGGEDAADAGPASSRADVDAFDAGVGSLTARNRPPESAFTPAFTVIVVNRATTRFKLYTYGDGDDAAAG